MKKQRPPWHSQLTVRAAEGLLLAVEKEDDAEQKKDDLTVNGADEAFSPSLIMTDPTPARVKSRPGTEAGWKQWILSLSWDELVTAAQLPLSAHEEQHWRDLVSAEVSPETPIHPCACPSRSYVNDGRSPSETKQRRRRQAPRLLTLLHPAEFHSLPAAVLPGTKRRRGPKALPISSYSVSAKSIIFPSGERLCIPEHRALYQADRRILDLVELVPVQSAFSNLKNTGKASSDGPITSVLRFKPFVEDDTGLTAPDDDREENRVRAIYRLWHTVSRGNLGSSRGRFTLTQTADWLEPTKRWFSLGMYLVSRLEVVLYQRFLGKLPHTPLSLLRGPFGIQSWRLSLQNILQCDQEACRPTRNPRQSILWELLDEAGAAKSPAKERALRQGVSSMQASLPLLLLDSSTGGLWKELCEAQRTEDARRIEEELLEEARRVEEELMGDIQDEETVKTATNKTTTRPNKRIKKKKKKKANDAKKEMDEPVMAQKEFQLKPNDCGEAGENDEADVPVMPAFSLKEERVPSREQNRNLVFAWSIVDNVLERVFTQVGLPTDEINEHSGLVPVGTKTTVIKKTSFLKAKSIIPVPSRPQPSREVGATSTKQPRSSSAGSASAAAKLQNRAPYGEDARAQKAIPVLHSAGTTWPFRQSDFLPQHTEDYVGVEMGEAGRPRRYDGLKDRATYEAFGGSVWFDQNTSDIPLWEPHNYVTLEQWGALQGISGRDRSIMEELFRTQQERELEEDENHMASSTIASIASSAEDVDVRVDEVMDVLEESPMDVDDEDVETQLVVLHDETEEANETPRVLLVARSSHGEAPKATLVVRGSRSGETFSTRDSSSELEARQLSPRALATPSPILSPILVSLEDLRGLGKDVLVIEKDRDLSPSQPGPSSVRSFSSVPAAIPAGSLPNSPRIPPPKIVSSLSRENLRMALSDDRDSNTRTPKRSPSAVSDVEIIPRVLQNKPAKMKSRDDTEIGPRGYVRKANHALDSYRNAAARALKSRDDQDLRQVRTSPPRNTPQRNPAVAYRSTTRAPGLQTRVLGPFPFASARGTASRDPTTRSEVGLGGEDDIARLHESRRSTAVDDEDNNTVTRDGSTTITSGMTQRETEESLREERDTYRDLCLTLGAEVASLKNLLASHRGSSFYPSPDNASEFFSHSGGHQFFDPDSVSNLVHRASRPQPLAAMSDAGYRGEHESMASDDDIVKDKTIIPQRPQNSSAATVGGSDISADQSVRLEITPVAVPSLRNTYRQVPIGGFHSRLGADILQFVESINLQLQKQAARRAKAVDRMTRLAKTVWPRAQVKVYGSHTTGLSLPTSDVDFVICLPAVHKNAPAVAPGALEGRNAINETSQKLLARKLKGESWIDPRSMQLIDRTVVPVIKVSTKDTKARSVHLDITFDGPSHHGVEAVDMVMDIMQELPMIRPLVLVLKRFLDDKNLLSAYKGGLSSYCLFLMTARYLQEQASSWGDCGSLLMGFLDFYGNHFNARTTGISVRYRQYFQRPNYSPAMRAQPIWPPQVVPPHHFHSPPVVGDKSIARRNSFNDKGGIDDVRATVPVNRTERFPTTGPNAAAGDMDPTNFSHGMTYTFEFDPLFVEDPLSPGNNVGRNAFRFPQIQRSFSDAHRALLAALEWDHESTEDLQDSSEYPYPLLNSLLKSEDVVYEL